MAEYYAGELDEEEMLQRAGPLNNAKSMAHYAIAMKSLALGDRGKAKDHFQKTAQTGMVGAWNYHWAKAFLECLEDPKWPSWNAEPPIRDSEKNSPTSVDAVRG